VRSIGSGAGDAWAPTRPVWNQHSYHVTNIEDDLSVPASEPPNWATYNTFRAADQPGFPAADGSPQPDLRIQAVADWCLDCDAGTVTFYVPIENQGLADAGPVELVFDVDGVELDREPVTALGQQESVLMGPFTFDTSLWTGVLTITVDGTHLEGECDEDNNAWVVGLLPCR
jgi:hypothetical protein